MTGQSCDYGHTEPYVPYRRDGGIRHRCPVCHRLKNKATRHGLHPLAYLTQVSVVDPDDMGHPLSDVSVGP